MDDDNVMELAMNFAAFLMFDEDDDDEDEPAVWEKVTFVLEEYRYMRNSAFKMHFRMSVAVFEELLLAVGQHLNDDNINHRDPQYDLGHVLLMVLWVLATPDCFRSVALRFGKTPGVLHYHYLRIINALSDMSELYIKWASHEERAIVKNLVRARTGFPGVVGAIDGCQIEIATPVEEPQRYFNRHHDFSIQLQAVCDQTLLFRDIYVGEVGSTHDSRVFRRSPISQSLLENPAQLLADDEHILGDGAYILTDKLLTPYRDYGNLTEEQRNYNHRHASSRVVIEQAFGRLKGKWRRLKWLSSVNIEYAVRTIVASTVLHNFILLEGEVPNQVHGENNAPHERIELLIDDGADIDFDHPNVAGELDHPLLAEARMLGVEKRRDITGQLPPAE